MALQARNQLRAAGACRSRGFMAAPRVVRLPVRCQSTAAPAMVATATEEATTTFSAGVVNDVSASTFNSLLSTAGERLVVIDVFTTWCGPCKVRLRAGRVARTWTWISRSPPPAEATCGCSSTPPSQMMAPELDKIAAEHTNVLVAKIDCTSSNENKKWAMEQKVKALPTFLMFKDGKRVTDMTGSKVQALRALVSAHM